MDFAERLATLRQEQDLTQEELAEKLNISRQSVSRWESRMSIPNMDSLILLSNFFGISMDELVKRIPEEPPAPAIPEADAAEPVVEPAPEQSDESTARRNVWKKRLLYAVTILLVVFGSLAVLSHKNSRDISEEKTMPLEDLHTETDDGEDFETFSFEVPFVED